MWKQSKMCSAPCFMSNKLFAAKRQSSGFQGTFPRAFSRGSGRTTADPLGRSRWCVDKVWRLHHCEITGAVPQVHTHTEHVGFNTELFPHSSGRWPAQMFQQSSCGFQWKEEITGKEKCLGELLQTDEYFTYQVRHHAHQSYSNWIFRSVIYVKITCKCSVSSLNYKRTLYLSYLIYFS